MHFSVVMQAHVTEDSGVSAHPAEHLASHLLRDTLPKFTAYPVSSTAERRAPPKTGEHVLLRTI